MKKDWFKGKGRFAAGTISLLFAVAAAGLIAFLGSKVMVVSRQGNIYTLDIFSDEEAFKDTTTFSDMLHVDLSNLSEYVAVCAQMEKNGQYDADREIDVFTYNNRKKDIKTDKEYPELIYRTGDLISWQNHEGFSYDPTEEYQQIRSETADGSIASEDVYEEEVSDASGDMAETLADNTDLVSEEEQADDYATEEDAGISDSYSKLTETYQPVNVDSIYDLKLPVGMTYQDVEAAVMEAANDLATNYNIYNRYKRIMKQNMNLKYLMTDENGNVQYTNLDRKQKTEDLVNAMQNCSVFMSYDYKTDTFSCSDAGAGKEVDYKSLLHSYRYSFPNGGRLYICVRTQSDDSNAIKLLGTWNEKDPYAQAEECYNVLKAKQPLSGLSAFVIICVILALLALLGYVAFMIMQPRRNKEELRYFDAWPTEMALCFALGSAFLTSLIGAYAISVISDMGSNNVYSGQMIVRTAWTTAVGTFFLLYLLLLVYTGSLVRRIKAGTLWKNSICSRLLLFCKQVCLKGIQYMKNAWDALVNHRSLVIRSFVPFYGILLMLLILNFLLTAAFSVGAALFLDVLLAVAVSFYIYHNNRAREVIVDGITKICEGDLAYQIETAKMHGENKVIAEAVNQIGNAVQNAVMISMKDERLKADLITNVSHDIKTPLTSIINYVDLLKRADIQNEKAQEYIRILDEKSQRLKHLTLDLVEASKISSGNITLKMDKLNVSELFKQAIGEYEDKWAEKKLVLVKQVDPADGEAPYLINADSGRTWRVLDNLFGNIYKYAMPGTRVYCDVRRIAGYAEENTVSDGANSSTKSDNSRAKGKKQSENKDSGLSDYAVEDGSRQKQQDMIEITVKNISAQPLNIEADELTERFIRGDVSRSTEGSGLGLSIAKNLVKAQGGEFAIYLDGDLFKVSITFPAYTGK